MEEKLIEQWRKKLTHKYCIARIPFHEECQLKFVRIQNYIETRRANNSQWAREIANGVCDWHQDPTRMLWKWIEWDGWHREEPNVSSLERHCCVATAPKVRESNSKQNCNKKIANEIGTIEITRISTEIFYALPTAFLPRSLIPVFITTMMTTMTTAAHQRSLWQFH